MKIACFGSYIFRKYEIVLEDEGGRVILKDLLFGQSKGLLKGS